MQAGVSRSGWPMLRWYTCTPRRLASSASGISLRMGEAGIRRARFEMGGVIGQALYPLRAERVLRCRERLRGGPWKPERRPLRIARFLPFVLFAGMAWAQEPADVRSVAGTVRDATTHAPISGAAVTAGDARSSTDADGRFEVHLSAGVTRLAISAAGYVDAAVDAAPAGAPVDVLLVARTRFSERLDVTAEADADAPALLPVRPRQVLTVAGAADNVFRVLQTLPGVAATEEFGSRLSVRGGTPDQNLTVMDGVEIHNPYRLFGLTSAFNPETVERFELTAGGFEA